MTHDDFARDARRRSIAEEAFARLFLKQAVVHSNAVIGDDFHRLELSGQDLRDADWTPLDVIQIGVGAFKARTYTPIEWDAETGRTAILAHAAAPGPGSAWVKTAPVGSRCEFFGPRPAAKRFEPETAVLFGDETSLGVACALKTLARGQVLSLFETSDFSATGRIIAALGLGQARLFERTADERHLEAAAQTLAELAPGQATFVLTGRAGAIQIMRRWLKAIGVAPARMIAKAHWAPGKVGLD